MLNKMMAKLALVVAPYGFELSTIHAWSIHNATCDELSRAKANDVVPEHLQTAVRSRDRRPVWAVLKFTLVDANCDGVDSSTVAVRLLMVSILMIMRNLARTNANV